MTDSSVSATAGATLRCPFCLKLNRVAVNRADDRPKCGSCGRPLLLDRPFKLQGEDLDRLIADAEVDVLVDFYADWCGPCKVMAPVLDAFAHDHAGELVVAKLDTDSNPEISRRLAIRGIPTLILFRGGREVQRKAGALPRQQIEEMIRAA